VPAFDLNRALQNWEAVNNGTEQFSDLSPEEQVDVLELLRLLNRGSTADSCGEGYRTCVNECEAASIYDYDLGGYIDAYQTDYPENCIDACRRGQNYCEDEDDTDEQCYEFRRICRRSCPTDVFHWPSSQYRLLTDAQDQCEESCRAGESACE
jgi:hypothetical protein